MLLKKPKNIYGRSDVFFCRPPFLKVSLPISHAHFPVEADLRPDHVSSCAGEVHAEMVGGADSGQPALLVS